MAIGLYSKEKGRTLLALDNGKGKQDVEPISMKTFQDISHRFEERMAAKGFVEGDLQPVDAALLKDLRNAYQTRLFSPELLRNRTLAAKMFDRIYAIPVDPDEFYVVPPGQSQFGGDSTSTSMRENETISTPSEIFDYYLNAGIIERTELPAPFEYKLAPRKTAEGSMALGSVTVSMTTIDDEQEVILGL